MMEFLGGTFFYCFLRPMFLDAPLDLIRDTANGLGSGGGGVGNGSVPWLKVRPPITNVFTSTLIDLMLPVYSVQYPVLIVEGQTDYVPFTLTESM